MSIIGRLFGARRHHTPEPTAEDVAAVDLDRMVSVARERGDRREEAEVVASLIVGAEVTAERHPDDALRSRAAAASVAATRWLVARVGEEEAARLVAASQGPVDEQGVPSRA
jgi:glutamyl-tRNA reductase